MSPPSVRSLLRVLVTTGSLVLGAAVAPAAAGAAAPGVVPDLTWYTSATDKDRTVLALKDMGSQWVRLHVSWRDTEKTRGNYDAWWLNEYADSIARARAAGQKIVVMVGESPSWASGSTNEWAPPSNPQDYGNFIRQLASRWAGTGVYGYEVWNEPNYSRFWGGTTPDPVRYTALLKAGYAGVKAGDPTAAVVFGGPSTNDRAFIERAYNAGAKDHFDIMGTHPYTCQAPDSVERDASGRIKSSSFLGYREIRAAMLARGDDKPMMFTEFGWSTTTGSCGVSEATQADYLTRAFKLMQEDPYVSAAMWYALRNNYWGYDADTYEQRFGLLRTDFTRKPAYDAFKTHATGALPGTDPLPPPPTTEPVPPPTTEPRPPRGKKKLRLQVTLASVAAQTARRARRRVHVKGHSAVARGRVRLKLYRRAGARRWKRVEVHTVRVRRGRFGMSLGRLGRGVWRVSARLAGGHGGFAADRLRL